MYRIISSKYIQEEVGSYYEKLLDITEFINLCGQCDKLYLGFTWNEDIEGIEGSRSILYPPSSKQVMPECVPEAIRDSYVEAEKVRKVSPLSYSVMIRRGLEFICKDQQANGNSLYASLTDLKDRDIIPNQLYEVASALRKMGNLGAHADESKITKGEANILRDLFLTMIEYIYVAPSKMQTLEERLKEFKKSKN